MDITVGILFYIASCEHETEIINTDSDSITVQFVAPFTDEKLRTGIVYYKQEKDDLLVFAVGHEKKFSSDSKHMSMIKIRHTSNASLLQDIIHRFYRMQNDMLQCIIAHKGLKTVLDYGAAFLKLPFLLTRKDLSVLYTYPSSKAGSPSHGPFLSDESLSLLRKELILSKDFHDAARLTAPFYFKIENPAQNHYCVNIMENGQYYARLVVLLKSENQILPSGAEQLVRLIADCCSNMVSMGQLRQIRDQKDALHMLLRNIGNNHPISHSQYHEALSAYGWLPEQEYRFLIVKVFDTTGWDSQIDATLEVIRNDLEETWPNSCAVTFDREIHWMINISYLPPDQNDYAFFDQLTIYIRENVCRVGASTIFRNVQLASFAKKQAEAALILGNKRNPSHWLFKFDDYRLTYIQEAILDKGLPKEMVAHPAIQTLTAYDRDNNSELTETLRTYLRCQSNATRAAEKLFIHRTTLFRRLERIRELTSIDFENEDQLFLLLLSFYV